MAIQQKTFGPHHGPLLGTVAREESTGKTRQRITAAARQTIRRHHDFGRRSVLENGQRQDPLSRQPTKQIFGHRFRVGIRELLDDLNVQKNKNPIQY